MTQANSLEYFHHRERQERRLASKAGDAAIAAIHLHMAERYSALTSQTAIGEKR